MVTSEEIIERTLYAAILRVALNLGVTINPEEYLPVNALNQKKYKADMDKIGSKFIYIFGVGNSQVKGQKNLPRITIELNGYFPGEIGVDQYMVGDREDNEIYNVYAYPSKAKDATFDIHLVSENINQMRLLHSIMYTALPAMGYVKPFVHNSIKEYLEDKGKLAKSGNLFLEIGNYYDHNDTEHGILEKVYTYNCVDGLLEETLADGDISPIKDISTLILPEGTEGITLQVGESNDTP